ncbi:hypothetical protein DVH24_010134 [Malus domestica]|uniref:EF-hand domain-containing protein n=1 Tax=Malus domestica TaxID=3750 RepID=A0A498JPD8_MALDO|nr:hypothetical protein DVH24_010134 [Malus domestica]
MVWSSANRNPTVAMASEQNQSETVDLFDEYFRRADLDRNGRIRGNEAVAFFQGSGLPKQVLAKGPQIQSQFNSAPTAPEGGAVTPTSSQNLGFRGLPPSVNVNQENFISQDGKSFRSPVPPSGPDSQPTQGVAAQGFSGGGSVGGPQPQNSSMVGGRADGTTTLIPSQVVNKRITPATQDVFGLETSGPTASLPPRPLAGCGISPPGPPAKDSKPSNISGNGYAPDSSFGDDVFSATPSEPKQNFPPGSIPVSSAIVPVFAGIQSSTSPSTQVDG